MTTRHVARWDLDKTYLRTEFDTVKDLVKTAFERPDEKRTNPGASTLCREMVNAGVSLHILSGSPEQMRRRLEEKLRLDGIRWDSFVLKPNLQNVLRLRFRAIKDQLGYKLPALLEARTRRLPPELAHAHETLFGDDAEADAFVYALYADLLAGKVGPDVLCAVCESSKMYADVLEETLSNARRIEPEPVVERILIHLERQSAPEDFAPLGRRVVPFYNYLQAAFVVHEDARVSAEGVLRVASEMVLAHRFDGDQLARSYVELARRGHLRGVRAEALAEAFEAWASRPQASAIAPLREMVTRLPAAAKAARERYVPPPEDEPVPDYLKLVKAHNPRRRRR